MISQNEAVTFVGLGFCLAFFGYFTILQARDWYARVLLEYEYMKHPRLVEYSERQVCPQGEPHKWRDVTLALRGLPVGKYKVCTTCASICGNSQFMVSNQVLDQIEEASKLLDQKAALELEIQNRIADLACAYVDQYIKRNFVQEVNDVHLADKLRALSKYTISALADASEKVASELTAQSDLEAKYKDWPSKIKGNA